MPAASYASLDDALDSLSGAGSGLTNGNFNHAPMVAEALCALGRPEAVMPWLEHYRPRMLPRGAAGPAIRAGNWRSELGRGERFAAWGEFFAEELGAAPWREMLGRWTARLAPGVSAAATHGAIRAGHAVRALNVAETPARRRELADALASWAASYRELPAADGSDGSASLAPREALAAVAIVPPERRRPGNITARLAGLADFPEFAPSIGLIAVEGDLDRLLAELTELFARVYLANVTNVPTAIAFIHGVTGLAALGHIAAHVEEPTARALLRYGWQAGCGLYSCYGSGAGAAGEIAPVAEDR